MGKDGSVEVGPPAKQGEGRARRYKGTADRLVDQPAEGINVIADLLRSAAERFPDRRAVGWRDTVKTINEEKEMTKIVGGEEVKETKKWTYWQLGDPQWITYKELAAKVKDAASALVETGCKGKYFNVYASTSVHWQIMANACATQGITFATAYDSLGEEGLQHSLAQPDVHGVFTNANLLSTIAAVIKKTPTVKVVVYDGAKEDIKKNAVETLKSAGVEVYTLDEFLKLGAEKPAEPDYPGPDDIACCMYTSGSTGAPKGVLLSNRNVVATVAGTETLLGELLTDDALYIAFLPASHIFEFTVEMLMLYVGVPMAFATVKTLTDTSVRNCVGDMRAFQPTIMCGVPAVWELIRKGIMSKVRAGGTVKQAIFNFAFTAKKYGPTIVGHIMDAVVFKAVKQATGGSLEYAVNGGAPISEATHDFLTTTLVKNFIAGYGMTESSAISFVLPPSMLRTGAVGIPTPSAEAKLVDFPDAGYLSSNSPPQGEVWIRGPGVTKGYFKQDKLTAETITEDGWLKTGDVGQWNADGTLSIIDRVKNLVKLSGGEYIAIERLESIYKSCNVVSNIAVHADQNANKPMAIIFPHEANLKNLVNDQSISVDKDFESMCKSEEVRKAVLGELNKVGKQAGLKGLEMLQTVILTPTEWTPQNEFLTAAQKLNRKKIGSEFKDQIKAVYP